MSSPRTMRSRCPGLSQVEYAQRHAVVPAHHDGGGVHDVEPLVEHAVVGQPRIVTRIRILDRVIRIDAIHLGGLEQQLRLDLDRAQAGGGIGGEERVAGAGREDHGPALLEVPDRAAADVVLADLVDADRRHDARLQALLLERVLQRQRVHDGREHAHLVRGHAVHAGARQTRAAKDVAAADHDRDLHAERLDFGDLERHALEHRGIDPVRGLPQQRLAGQLHEDPAATGLRFLHGAVPLRAVRATGALKASAPPRL